MWVITTCIYSRIILYPMLTHTYIVMLLTCYFISQVIYSVKMWHKRSLTLIRSSVILSHEHIDTDLRVGLYDRNVWNNTVINIIILAMYKGGRLQNSVWEFVLHVTVENKKYAKCKKCDHQQVNNVARCKSTTQNVQWISINGANIFQLWKYSH